MALSLEELHRLRDDLVRSRAAGIRELRDSSGETIVYKSDNEMRAAISAVESEISRLTSARPHTILFRTSKGI